METLLLSFSMFSIFLFTFEMGGAADPHLRCDRFPHPIHLWLLCGSYFRSFNAVGSFASD